ncbi:MAG: YfhO family protein [Acidobacteria bacterium]|nr:YfhO family protein [Acidobacteriota bacterium]
MIQKPARYLATNLGLQSFHILGDRFWRLKYPVLLFLFTVTIFWKLIFSNEYSMLTYPDSSFQTYPWSQYLAGVLHQCSFPFWDMYADAGRSFIGETQTGAFYPLNLLMGALPLNAKGLVPVSVIEGFIILHAFLASVFMYGLARHFGLSSFSSCVAGIVFAFSGSVGMRAFAQVNLFYGTVWVPAVFWCYARSLQAQRWKRQVLFANLAGLALALTLLAGHHQPFIYTSLAVTGVAAALWFKSKTRPAEGLCRPGLIFRQTLLLLVFALAYSSLQLLPSLEYSKLAYRWVDSVNPSLVSQRVSYSVAGSDNLLPPHGLILLVLPYIGAAENSPYLGILPLLLVLFSLPLLKKHYVAKLAFGVALLFAALSLGHFSPLHGLMYALVPGFDKGREASRLFLLAHFGLSLLAGFGCQAFFQPCSRRERPWRIRVVTGFAALSLAISLVVFALYFYQAQVLSQNPDYGAPGFACLLLLATSAIGLARTYGLAKTKSLQMAVVFILLFDFHFLLFPHIKLKRDIDRKVNFEPKQYYQQDDVVRFLQSQSGVFRVDFREKYYPANLGQVFKLETINGYGATCLKQFYHFWAEAYPVGNAITDMMNVRYVVSQQALDLPVAFQGQHAKVYENPGFLPRAWLASQIVARKDLNEIIPLLRSPSFDPYAVGYVEEPLSGSQPLLMQTASLSSNGENFDRGTAVYTRVSPNRFRVKTTVALPKLLVVSQNWYPGWKARVNGERRKVERVNGALMGVWLEAGQSEIELSYRPTHFYWAAVMTLAAFGVLGGCFYKQGMW